MNGLYDSSQRLSSIHAVPDPTLLRFPSDDPFAYPPQPLSSFNKEAFLSVPLATPVQLPNDPALQIYAVMSDEYALENETLPFDNSFLGAGV